MQPEILHKPVKSAILIKVHKNVCYLLQRLQLFKRQKYSFR